MCQQVRRRTFRILVSTVHFFAAHFSPLKWFTIKVRGGSTTSAMYRARVKMARLQGSMVVCVCYQMNQFLQPMLCMLLLMAVLCDTSALTCHTASKAPTFQPCQPFTIRNLRLNRNKNSYRFDPRHIVDDRICICDSQRIDCYGSQQKDRNDLSLRGNSTNRW